MTWVDWLLIYLLCGFALSFVANVVMRGSWAWELAATILWPIAIVVGLSRPRRNSVE